MEAGVGEPAPEPGASGLALSLTAALECWGNLAGGERRGALCNGLVEGQLAWSGKTGELRHDLCVQVLGLVNQERRRSFSDYVGAANPVSGLQAGDALRVYNVYWRVEGASWALKAGQLALDDDFMLSEQASFFANSVFGAMPSQVAPTCATGQGGSAAFAVFPVASPGLHASWFPEGPWSLQAGVYHGGPGPDERGNPGWDWRRHAGLATFVEAALELPRLARGAVLRAGLAGHSCDFDDQRAAARGQFGREVRGLCSAYLVQDLSLLTREGGEPLLCAFWRAGFAPQEGRAVVSRHYDLGFTWHGPLSARREDTLGLAWACTQFAGAYRTALGAEAPARREFALELAYECVLSPAWRLQGDLQWLQLRRGGALVAGLRLSAAFPAP